LFSGKEQVKFSKSGAGGAIGPSAGAGAKGGRICIISYFKRGVQAFLKIIAPGVPNKEELKLNVS
jgi:hypothetical protein